VTNDAQTHRILHGSRIAAVSSLLNRVYIVIGVVLILLLTAAFVVPRLYDWSPYRQRMEQIASDALGTDVRINGDLSFVLLPQPQMVMSQVAVGPTDSPILQIERVDAHLALMQFLRDQYDVQKLVLDTPSFHLRIAQDGGLELPLALAQNGGRDNVAIEDAQIINGSFLLSDTRADEHWLVESVKGKLSAAAMRGPFEFTGSGRLDENELALRINTSDLNERGDIRISTFVSPSDKSFSLSTEGLLTTASLSPFFDGELTLRITPQNLAENEVRGDMILDGKVQLSPDRFKLTEYTLQPDENRAGTRLTGAVDVRLGENREFDVVLSGGVVPLLPDDALSATADDPYALVSLLSQLPAPPALGNVSGHVSVDVTELGLKALGLRNVLLDAKTDGQNWTVESFSAKLPGDTLLSLSGELISAQGNAAFDGRFSMETERLDALARSWRAFGETNPLFGAKASLVGDVDFSNSGATFSNLNLNLDGFEATGKVDWREENKRLLSINADFGAFDDLATAQLIGLLPDPNRPRKFNSSFPIGAFRVSAQSIDIAGQLANGVLLEGQWDENAIDVAHVRVDDIAHIRMEGHGQIEGPLNQPRLSGALRTDFQPQADIGALWSVLPLPKLHPSIERIFSANRPARFDFELTEPGSANEQKLILTSSAGELSMNADVALSAGLTGAFTSPTIGSFEINAPSANSLFSQLGIESASFDDQLPAKLEVEYKGTVFNSVQLTALYSSAEEALGYQGSLIVSDLDRLRGTGELRTKLSDTEGFAAWVGLESFQVPTVNGKATLKFVGADDIELQDIQLRAGDEDVAGAMQLRQLGDVKVITGDLNIGRLDVEAFAAFLGGNASTLKTGQQIWPDGPFSVNGDARNTRGRLHVETPLLMINGGVLLTEAGFDVSWTNAENRIRNLVGARGQGEITADISLCCHGGVAQKQVSGRFAVDGVSLDDIFPAAVSHRVSGQLSGSGQFSGAGEDFASVVAKLGGEGSFTVMDVAIENFDPKIFEKINAVENVLELEAEQLEAQVLADLEGAPYLSNGFEGIFSLAAGKVLISNVAMEDERTRLFGDVSLALVDLGLESGWSLTPTQNIGDGSVLDETTGRVDALISGTLDAPIYKIDIQQMVDSIQVKAFELEVERLEKLRAEQEARALAQAEEQQRRMAEQAAQLAKEEAAKAAALEAERQKKKAEAAAKAAAEAAIQQDTNSSIVEVPPINPDDQPLPLLDLDALFDPNAPFDPSATDQQLPIDLIEGGN
jgi:uncharacterized protein involved in outer membrane biogenesis